MKWYTNKLKTIKPLKVLNLILKGSKKSMKKSSFYKWLSIKLKEKIYRRKPRNHNINKKTREKI